MTRVWDPRFGTFTTEHEEGTYKTISESWEYDTPETIALRAERDEAEKALRPIRRACESSPEATEAGRAAKRNPDAPGRYTRGGDRRYSRAVETTGRAMPEYRAAKNRLERAKRALEREMIRVLNDPATGVKRNEHGLLEMPSDWWSE